MNRELCKKLLADGTLKAWSEGKTIQLKDFTGWIDFTCDDAHFGAEDYRIKPEPEYIPFTSETAVAAGLHKRRVSFNGFGSYEVYIGENKTMICGVRYSFYEVLATCKFLDTGDMCGTQVGGFS